jgi:hypothetical protein
MDNEEIKSRLDNWIKSDEGRKEMEQACDQAKDAVEYLEKEREINWLTLHEPFTI